MLKRGTHNQTSAAHQAPDETVCSHPGNERWKGEGKEVGKKEQNAASNPRIWFRIFVCYRKGGDSERVGEKNKRERERERAVWACPLFARPQLSPPSTPERLAQWREDSFSLNRGRGNNFTKPHTRHEYLTTHTCRRVAFVPAFFPLSVSDWLVWLNQVLLFSAAATTPTLHLLRSGKLYSCSCGSFFSGFLSQTVLLLFLSYTFSQLLFIHLTATSSCSPLFLHVITHLHGSVGAKLVLQKKEPLSQFVVRRTFQACNVVKLSTTLTCPCSIMGLLSKSTQSLPFFFLTLIHNQSLYYSMPRWT